MQRQTVDHLQIVHERWRASYAKTFIPTHVPGEGQDVDTEVMIIGEAPGAEEVLRGRPFVGASGKVLRQLMDTAGLLAGKQGSNCWLTNVCQFRPPNNRTPSEKEVRSLRPILRREWEAVGKPRIIIPVGSTALFAVTGERWSVLKTAGRVWKLYSARSNLTFALWPMIHPSYALRNKEARPLIERDWERLADWLRYG